jgi:hypothetical protein
MENVNLKNETPADAKPVLPAVRIVIEPELPIGTEFWIMKNNRPELGLIAAYNVYVTSCVDSNRGWHEQLFGRWLNKKQKEVWKYSYSYEVKLDTEIIKFGIEKKNGVWWLLDRRVYFSLGELKAAL